MNDKKLNILAGLVTIFSGYITYRDSWEHLYGFKVPKSLGVLLICFGFLCIAFGIFKKKTISSYKTILKCPKCLKVFREADVENNRCPSCGFELEPLKGFFERHPDKGNIRDVHK